MSTEEKVQRLAGILREIMDLVVFDPRVDRHSLKYIEGLKNELEELQEDAV